jgi:hypothetical protein
MLLGDSSGPKWPANRPEQTLGRSELGNQAGISKRAIAKRASPASARFFVCKNTRGQCRDKMKSQRKNRWTPFGALLAGYHMCMFDLSRLRNGSPLWASRSSSCLVQSQLQQAQASWPFKSRQFLRECASFTLNSSKYSSQYERSSASGVGQKQTSTQRTVPASSSRACSMSSRYSSPATEP